MFQTLTMIDNLDTYWWLTHIKASILTLLIIVSMFTVEVCSSSGHWILKATINFIWIPKITAPLAFRFSSQKAMLLSGSRYFRMVKNHLYHGNSSFRQSWRIITKWKVLFTYVPKYQHTTKAHCILNKKGSECWYCRAKILHHNTSRSNWLH